MLFQLETSIQYVKGIGPKRVRMFAETGIFTIEDLLKYHPFRYENRSIFRKIRDLQFSKEAVVQGQIHSIQRRTTARKRIQIVEMSIRDESGLLSVKFLLQSQVKKQREAV